MFHAAGYFGEKGRTAGEADGNIRCGFLLVAEGLDHSLDRSQPGGAFFDNWKCPVFALAKNEAKGFIRMKKMGILASGER